MRNKNKQQWQNQRQEKPRWLRWINKEPQRSSQKNGKSKRRSKLRLCSQKPRNNLMKILTTSSIWTKWSCTQRLLPLETSKLMKTNNSSKNGLKNKRNSTSWWKSRDLRSWKLKKNVRPKSKKCASKVNKLSLIKSKKELSKEWKSKKFETKRDFNFFLISKRWRKRMRLNKKTKEDKLIFWCNKQPKQTNKLLSKKTNVQEKKKNKKKKLSLIKSKEIAKNMRLNSRLRELRMKRKEKSRDSENCKKRQLIDKLKLMHSEQREHLRRVKDKLERGKDLSIKRDSV